MKKILLSIILSLVFVSIKAQVPAPVKKSSSSTFEMNAFDANGKECGKGYGVFIGTDGTAVGSWKPFVGASRVVITDALGKKYDVECIIAADELYDMAKFKVSGSPTGVKAATANTSANAKIWAVELSKGNTNIIQGNVKSVETFADKYGYYILGLSSNENSGSFPVFNATGEVVGLLEQSNLFSNVHATSVRYILDMVTPSMAINNQTLRQTGVQIALPSDKNDALLALMMSSQQGDKKKELYIINSFVNQFPSLVDGYVSRARFLVEDNNFSGAEKDMQTAIKVASDKASAHFDYAKLIYDKEVFKGDVPYQEWSLDKAMSEAQEACRLDNQPTYQHLVAQILFSQEKYQEAYDKFMLLGNAKFGVGEPYYEAAQCKMHMNGNSEEIEALLDKAVFALGDSITHDAAPFVLARGQYLEQKGDYRKASSDYVTYEYLTQRIQTPEFYFMRAQCEANGRLYQQALSDYTRCIVLNPKEVGYVAEMGSLLLRLNRLDDAETCGQNCIEIDNKYSAGYLLLGLVQIHKNNKAEGLKNLEKAKDLGNEQAAEFIAKYK